MLRINGGDYEQERRIQLLIDLDELHCMGIWGAVLIQAGVDARSSGRGKEAIKAKAEALAWFADADEESEFALVCEMAGLDLETFRKDLKRYLHNGTGVDFRCARKCRPQKRRQVKHRSSNKRNCEARASSSEPQFDAEEIAPRLSPFEKAAELITRESESDSQSPLVSQKLHKQSTGGSLL